MDERKSVKPRTDAQTLEAILRWVDGKDGDDVEGEDDIVNTGDDDIAAADLHATGEPTAAVKHWAREQHAEMRFRIAALRRQLAKRHPPIQHEPPVGPAIRALSRGELLARLSELAQGDAVQLAHMDLDVATDEDLRQMLTVLTDNLGASDKE